MTSAPTLAFDLRPSYRVAGAAVPIVVTATLAPWLSDVHPALRVGLSLLVLAVGLRGLWRFLHGPFGRVAHSPSGWLLIDATGRDYPAVLESHAHLGALICLSFRYAPRARWRAVLAPDNLDADTHRRLVLLLARAEIAQPSSH
ncbi:MAG: hypothetical protein LBQ20_06955 [Rhodanobacter sp.]|jgi:hypothetical protein|nr:hypothetical protein [Rhodanobacter sp.]